MGERPKLRGDQLLLPKDFSMTLHSRLSWGVSLLFHGWEGKEVPRSPLKSSAAFVREVLRVASPRGLD